MTSHKFLRSSGGRPVLALLLACLTVNIAARAQDSPDESTASAPVVFHRENTPSPAFNNILRGISGDVENDIWTVGTFAQGALALHFDGSKWGTVPMALPNTADMRGVSVLSADDVWAVGSVFDSNNHFISVIQHFDGKNWSVVPNPHFASGDQLFAVKAIAQDDVFAVGELHSDNQQPLPLIEHFDGNKWVVIPAPALKKGQTLTLGTIAAVSHSDVWVTGSNFETQPSPIFHFDGETFRNVPFPIPTASLDGLVAIATDDVWVVGAQLKGNATATLTAHWDGKRWTIVPSPNLTHDPVLRAVSAISSSDIWAAGCTTCNSDIGVNQVILVEHWDGKRWTINPTPLIGRGDFDFPGSVLTFPSGSVYVSGTSAGRSLAASQTLVLHATEGK